MRKPMKMAPLILFLPIFSMVNVHSRQTEFPKLAGPYLGQKPPGMTPELFASDIITVSTHSVAIFSPDGREAYYVPWSTLKMETMKLANGAWTSPETVSIASVYDAENPMFTADGSRLYFTSTRPLKTMASPEKSKFWRENIWSVARREGGWSEPVPLGPEVNSLDLHWQLSIDDRNHDLYFSASAGETGGRSDIYQSVFSNGRHTDPVKLGPAVNTDGDEDTPFIAADGSYLIFARKPGADTFSDLCVSFRARDGSWKDAVPFDGRINSKAHEVCPVVTRDGNISSSSA
ncbi:MAG: hypothetical protein OEW05_13230 [Candidatus Aminicenantes bacterium]|nr:hypothetical protein [Candidatus Aminicenantes bacterium]